MSANSLRPVLLLVVGLGLLPSSTLAGGAAVGSEFQVNTYTTNYQRLPSVATAADGTFVVVWESYGSAGTDSSYFSVQGQRFAANGSPQGGEFQVNTYTTDSQRAPAVAVAANGNFIVVWQSRGSAGTDSENDSVQGQRYAANGAPLGGEFQINTYTTSYQGRATVAIAADGDFIVVWSSIGSAGTDTDGDSIHGQRYAADGSPLGSEFQVNTYTTNDQDRPEVGVFANGDFVVVWGGNASVQGQRYTANGAPLGGEFQINTYTTGGQGFPVVAVAADGTFVVAWSSTGSIGSDTDSTSIQRRHYAADGSPLGDEFQVNTYTTSHQTTPAVAIAANGDFVVVWRSLGSAGTDSDFTSIQGQCHISDGSPLGGQFQVNTYTFRGQYYPRVAVAPDGNFVVAWSNQGGDDDYGIIQGQRYRPVVVVFADGFESGDTSGWSTAVP